MLTIPMMVRVGAWTVTAHERVTVPENCERCGKENILNIWICEVDPDAIDRLNVLRGQHIWRIGSKCGPTLEGVSDAMWKSAKSEVSRKVRTAFRYVTLRDRAKAERYDLPAVIIQQGEALLRNAMDESRLKWLTGVMTSHERKLKIRD